MTELQKKVGSKISHLRKENGYTQKELAIAVGYSTQHIGLIETGRDRPSIDILYQICAVLKCDILELLPSIKEVKPSDFNVL